jgi:hypothetical protein
MANAKRTSAKSGKKKSGLRSRGCRTKYLRKADWYHERLPVKCSDYKSDPIPCRYQPKLHISAYASKCKIPGRSYMKKKQLCAALSRKTHKRPISKKCALQRMLHLTLARNADVNYNAKKYYSASAMRAILKRHKIPIQGRHTIGMLRAKVVHCLGLIEDEKMAHRERLHSAKFSLERDLGIVKISLARKERPPFTTKQVKAQYKQAIKNLNATHKEIMARLNEQKCQVQAEEKAVVAEAKAEAKVVAAEVKAEAKSGDDVVEVFLNATMRETRARQKTGSDFMDIINLVSNTDADYGAAKTYQTEDLIRSVLKDADKLDKLAEKYKGSQPHLSHNMGVVAKRIRERFPLPLPIPESKYESKYAEKKGAKSISACGQTAQYFKKAFSAISSVERTTGLRFVDTHSGLAHLDRVFATFRVMQTRENFDALKQAMKLFKTDKNVKKYAFIKAESRPLMDVINECLKNLKRPSLPSQPAEFVSPTMPGFTTKQKKKKKKSGALVAVTMPVPVRPERKQIMYEDVSTCIRTATKFFDEAFGEIKFIESEEKIDLSLVRQWLLRVEKAFEAFKQSQTAKKLNKLKQLWEKFQIQQLVQKYFKPQTHQLARILDNCLQRAYVPTQESSAARQARQSMVAASRIQAPGVFATMSPKEVIVVE